MNVRCDVPLTSFNTFSVSCTAKYFAEITSEQELAEILSDKKFCNLPMLPLGGGSNILFTGDFNGLVLKINLMGIEFSNPGNSEIEVSVGAGEPWHDLVNLCIKKNYGGIENLSLIPGNAGAAPIQNIGAYGVEIKDVLKDVTVMNIHTGEKIILDNADCNFKYRKSVFKNEFRGEFIVLSIRLKLSEKPVLNTQYGAIEKKLESMGVEQPTIKDVGEAVCRIRRSKLPDPRKHGNAGSFFKNPVIRTAEFEKLKIKYPDIVGYPESGNMTKVAAGWLIDKAGWKGKRILACGVHDKQALVLINYGKASGKEILELADLISGDILNKFGIQLEKEVNII